MKLAYEISSLVRSGVCLAYEVEVKSVEDIYSLS
jgi:hypothetical protein